MPATPLTTEEQDFADMLTALRLNVIWQRQTSAQAQVGGRVVEPLTPLQNSGVLSEHAGAGELVGAGLVGRVRAVVPTLAGGLGGSLLTTLPRKSRHRASSNQPVTAKASGNGHAIT